MPKLFRKLIPSGPAFTIVRDPVEAFESGYVYYDLEGLMNMDINEFARNINGTGTPRPAGSSFGKNNQVPML